MSPSLDCHDARRVQSALSTWEHRLADEVSRLVRELEIYAARSPGGGLDSQPSAAALEEAAERLAEVRSSLGEIEASCDSAARLAARSPASECAVAIFVPVSPRTDHAPRPRPLPRLRWSGSPLDDIFRRGAAHEAAKDELDDERGPLYGAYGASIGPVSGHLSNHTSTACERTGDAAVQGRWATRHISRAAAERSPILANAATFSVPAWAEDDVALRLFF
jgi:hypothetical protein